MACSRSRYLRLSALHHRRVVVPRSLRVNPSGCRALPGRTGPRVDETFASGARSSAPSGAVEAPPEPWRRHLRVPGRLCRVEPGLGAVAKTVALRPPAPSPASARWVSSPRIASRRSARPRPAAVSFESLILNRSIRVVGTNLMKRTATGNSSTVLLLIGKGGYLAGSLPRRNAWRPETRRWPCCGPA